MDSQFQSYDDVSDSSQSAARVARLREALRALRLDAFLTPRADEHQGEYVPPGAERLAWLTGFTGSAGVALVALESAALFVDGRYTIQAAHQIDGATFSTVLISDQSPEAWARAHLSEDARIGFDPWLHTTTQIDRLKRALPRARFVPVSSNPIDALWSDRPGPPLAPISLHPLRYAGEPAEEKLARIRAALDGAHALVVSDPHAIAWAFNLRGSDVPHTPIALGWALIRADAARLYFAPEKVSPSVSDALGALAERAAPDVLARDLAALGADKATVRFDAATAPYALVRAFEDAGGRAIVDADPIALMKACKNRTELRGARAAHLRDGVALTRFLAWLAGAAPTGKLTEIAAAEALERFRFETGRLKDLSFPTISAFGPHGALPHYRVSRASDRKIGKGLYLVDSGAQYEDGTTDVTRTVAIGEPSDEMRDRFTRVLKGHIAIARAVFPIGVSGAQLDSFARRALWEIGLDFDHGVGHGVGSYLSVHEGPVRISKLGTTPLAAGMIISNEPAFYQPGRYGIRIENLIATKAARVPGSTREVLSFETLTLAPIDQALIDPALMSPDEIEWLDRYHAQVRAALTPHLESATRDWLHAATRALRSRPRKDARQPPSLRPARSARAIRPR
jgi:Xaa-Pro aminopeptidase